MVRDSKGYVTSETLPDGMQRAYQYQTAFHALTQSTRRQRPSVDLHL